MSVPKICASLKKKKLKMGLKGGTCRDKESLKGGRTKKGGERGLKKREKKGRGEREQNKGKREKDTKERIKSYKDGKSCSGNILPLSIFIHCSK
jgi:hypothetical protein